MSQKFIQALTGETSFTRTENGALAHSTTGSALVDLFGVIGSLRSRSEQDIERLFSLAFAEDNLLATKMAFHGRNVRGGHGERDTGRTIFKYLANHMPEVIIKNLQFIPFFGRWDDLFELEGTPVEEAMWGFIKDQWTFDKDNFVKGKGISLMAKWLHSTDTSSNDARRLGRKTARRLDITVKEYQATLRHLRRYLDIPEVKMSANQWDKIVYSAVPSRAMMIYRKAFSRHDGDRFGEFINKVSTGEAKINASTLYPYDIMERIGVTTQSWGTNNLVARNPDSVLEEMWKAFPDLIKGEHNFLVMSDTSDSMRQNSNSRPLYTAVGLAIYFAERNKGVFKDIFMTFSSRPSLVKLVGSTLAEKVACIPSIVENTNLQAAFELILRTAVESNISADEMPRSLIVISDMEIDSANGRDTFHRTMKNRFAEKGYELPNVVYWNVHSRHDVFHATCHVPGVQLASGQSVSVFKSIIASIGKTGYEAMVEAMNDPMYDGITI